LPTGTQEGANKKGCKLVKFLAALMASIGGGNRI